MVFSSPIFLFLYLPIVLLIYFIVPRRTKNYFLLISSLLFYFWGEQLYVIIILSSITFNYLFGLMIDRVSFKSKRRLILIAALVFNLGILCYFKYGNFLIENLNLCFEYLKIKKINYEEIHLPLGISFFTFQAISYLIDIYREEYHSHKNPIYAVLYISFFPQLIAGPIVRYNHIASELFHRKITVENFSEGVKRFVIGLAKKVLIANIVAVPADAIFNIHDENLSCAVSWIGTFCYTLQIYFDFSGYSDMAIGLGKMFGFSFHENFNYPYVSKSIREFWKRWHISMTTWFRDYLYIPLGGNRSSSSRTLLNLIVVFFLSGLWHGASWNFVLWGVYHGAFLVIERIKIKGSDLKISTPIRHCYVIIVVMVGWVFFRATDIDHAFHILKTMAGLTANDPSYCYGIGMYIDVVVIISMMAGIIFSTPIYSKIQNFNKNVVMNFCNGNSRIMFYGYTGIKFLGMILIMILVSMQLFSQTYNPFIYFRF